MITESPLKPGCAWTTRTYAVRLARNRDEVQAAQALRFAVFNLELKEGLDRSYASGLDSDAFDEICDHLIITDTNSGKVMGTYRLLLDCIADKTLGFYSAKRFDLSRLRETLAPGRILEVGRSCIHREYRRRPTLSLLWHSIAQYSVANNVRYILGSPSILTKDPLEVSRYLMLLKDMGFLNDLGICPIDEFHRIPIVQNIKIDNPKELFKKLPPLFQGYLDMGAKVCGLPAVNSGFGTTIFFIVLDLENMNPWYKKRFLGDLQNQDLTSFKMTNKHAYT